MPHQGEAGAEGEDLATPNHRQGGEQGSTEKPLLQDVAIRIIDNPMDKYSEKDRCDEVQKNGRIKRAKGDHSSVRSSTRTRLQRSLLLFVVILVLICAGQQLYIVYTLLYTDPPYNSSSVSDNTICLTKECVTTASSLLSGMDWSSNPCEDFFQFACGTWNKKHVIPEDRSSFSTFDLMAEELQIILKRLLEEPFDHRDNGATFKAKTFYKACMNKTQLEKIADAPLKDVLEKLGGWPVTEGEDWSAPNSSVEFLLGSLRGQHDLMVFLEQWVGPDDKNSSDNIIQIDQASLGLPSSDYFANLSSAYVKAYRSYMTDVAILLGAEPKVAYEEMSHVINLEAKLAEASVPEEDRHNPGLSYNKLSLSELQKQVPDFNWLEYLNAFLPLQINSTELLVSYSLMYLQKMAKMIKSHPRKTIHNYALWRLVAELVPHMGNAYREARSKFHNVLLGISGRRVRWNYCVEWTNKKLGMAVGALFIRENFNHESKETALEMIHTIREAFSELLEENEWMDVPTRIVAREKANVMNERIGYPQMLTNPSELSKEYDQLVVEEDQHLENMLAVMFFGAWKNLRKFRKRVNKDKWSTEPAVVNAFYNPNKNDIVFPAGILQPLFYSQHFPKSLNYGGIGVVIGHEITHGFDDKGRQYDKEGNLRQWWNNVTIEAFKTRKECIIDQYSQYKLEQVQMSINGRMTQGENIADNGGLKQAFRAYRKWVERNGKEKLLPGLNMTHEQLFFLNYAQIWCGTMRPEDAISKIRSSVHSPGPIRVLGPLSNSYDFAEAYQCPLGSRMNPMKKCSVW